MDILPDVLKPNLKIVFYGMAAGVRSASVGTCCVEHKRIDAKRARRLENYFVTSTLSCRCLSNHRYSFAIPFEFHINKSQFM